MSKILSTTTSTFRFYDELDPYAPHYCDTTVTLEHRQYNSGKQYYHIRYTHAYPNACKQCHMTNPFHNSWPDGEEPYDCIHGDIIVANKMSEQLVNYIMMDSDELQNYAGSRTANSYRANTMRAITHLWD